MSNSTGGPPKKKQKMDRLAMEGPTVGLSRLTKHQVDFTPDLSPGALHSNRVAIQDTQNVDDSRILTTFFASGRDVSYLTIPSGSDGGLGERGKGGVYLPKPAADASCTLIPEISLRSEIQSITLSSLGPDGTCTLAASDSYGRAALARLHFPTKSSGDSISGQQIQPQLMGFEPLQSADVAVEGGWTGVAIAPGQPSQTAIARHFPKDITLFDGPMAVRTIYTMHRPNAVQLLSSDVADAVGGGPLVAAAEGPVISVWDVRASGRGSRVARLCPNPHAGNFYCIAASSGGGPTVLGAAGADRSVVVWDPRTWRPIDRWTNCLKYEATSLYFLSSNPNYCVACGLDYEVVCGKWGGDRRNRVGGGHRTKGNHGEAALLGADDKASVGGDVNGTAASSEENSTLSFRGDSRWMGLAKAHGRDVVAGLTASKQLYLAELGV